MIPNVTGERVARRYWFAPVFALAVLFGSAGAPGAGAADQASAVATLVWSRARPDTVIAVQTSEPVVALSFDDGPDPRWTPAVLDVLDRFGVKATFFFQGDHVEAHKRLARDTLRRGHELANHTYDHPDLPVLDKPAVAAQIAMANDAFTSADLPRPTLFRPPRGRFDDEAAAAVNEAGLSNIGWTHGLCIEKWTTTLEPKDAAEAVLDRVRPGAILLAHDGGSVDRDATVAALPHLVRGLQDRGYRIVTVGELLARTGRLR